MRGNLTGLAVCASLVLGLTVQAQEKPTPEYQAAMKSLGATSITLRANIQTLNYAGMASDVQKMRAAFTTALEFWKAKNVPDAIELAQTALKGVDALEAAAKAENHAGVLEARNTIQGDPNSGVIGAIGTCAPCHTAHRVRQVDGTYIIK
jgi:hypothetical protein